MVGVGRDLCGSSSPTPLPKQGLLQQATQDPIQAGFRFTLDHIFHFFKLSAARKIRLWQRSPLLHWLRLNDLWRKNSTSFRLQPPNCPARPNSARLCRTRPPPHPGSLEKCLSEKRQFVQTVLMAWLKLSGGCFWFLMIMTSRNTFKEGECTLNKNYWPVCCEKVKRYCLNRNLQVELVEERHQKCFI